MTIVTEQIARIGHPSGDFRLEFDWDDTNATIDPDSGEKHADTGELLIFRVINDTSLVGTVTIRRPNRTVPWKEFSVSPGMTQTIDPKGPVKKVADFNAGLSLGR